MGKTLRTLGNLSVPPTHWDITLAVSLAIAWDREYGWVAAGDREFGELSSSQMLAYGLTTAGNRETGTPLVTPTAAELEEALAAVSWVKDHLGHQHDDRQTSQESALVVLARGGFCDRGQIGLACSIHRLYREWLRRPPDAVLPVSPSVHLGQPKDRLDLTVEVTAILGPYAGQYGDSYLCKMRAGENELIWWTGENLSLEVDRRYVVKATVASHDEYNGTKQTRVQRLKVVEELS